MLMLSRDQILRPLFLVASLSASLALQACQSSRKAIVIHPNTNPTASGSIVASIQGVSPEDEKRAEVSYQLVCQGKTPVVGKLAEAEGRQVALFEASDVKDGDNCALEFRAAPEAGLVWLTEPQVAGLYYASEQGVVKNRRLSVTLFKTYRKGEETTGSVAVNVTDGGTCERFDVATRTCASLVHALGATLATNASGDVVIQALESDSKAGQAGLLAGDIIVLLDEQEITDLAGVASYLKSIENSGASSISVSYVRQGNAGVAFITL